MTPAIAREGSLAWREGATRSPLSTLAGLALLAACGSEPAPSPSSSAAGTGGMLMGGMLTGAGVSGSSGTSSSNAGSAGVGGSPSSGVGGAGGSAGGGSDAGASVAGAAGAVGVAGAAGDFPAGFKVLVFIGEHQPHSHDSRINDDYSHCEGDTGDVKGTSNCGSRFIEALGKLEGFTTDVSFDPSVFSAENLARYAVVVWVGNWNVVPIPDAGRAAFQQYLEGGGGSVALHYSISMDPNWAFYRDALLGGGTFVNHSGLDPAKVSIEDVNHPATRMLGASMMVVSDYFQMSSDPRPNVHVLASIDDATIKQTGHLDGSVQGSTRHPVVWSKENGKGRSLYSTFGHDAAEYDLTGRPWMRPFMTGALRWVAHLDAG